MNALKPLICAALCLASAVPCLAQTVTEIPLTVNHIVYSPQHGVIYASVPGRAGAGGNSITVIDPVQAKVTGSTFAGSEPDLLALSDDGLNLYTSLDGAEAIQRVDLPTLTLGPVFHPGNPEALVDSLAVLPGKPHSLAVSTYESVSIYDDSVARTNSVSYPNNISSLTFSPSGQTLYGSSYYDTISQYAVDSQGVTLQHTAKDLLNGSVSYDPSTRLLYSDTGATINPNTLNQTGIYNTYLDFPHSGVGTESTVSIALDSANNYVYLLSMDDYARDGAATITEYDAKTYLPIGSLVIPNAYTMDDPDSGIGNLITWGSQGLAFINDDGMVFLINGRSFPGVESLTVNQTIFNSPGQTTATVTLTQPAPSGGVTIALSGVTPSPNAVGPFSFPESVTIPSGATTGSFSIQASAVTTSALETIDASYGAQNRAVDMQVLAPGATHFYPGNVRVLPLGAKALAFDSATGLIYASIPSDIMNSGNSIVGIDAETGATSIVIPAVSEPGALAVTSDDTSLYIGVDGASAVRRYDFSAGTFGLTLPLDNGDSARKIAPLPGAPHSFVLSLTYPDTFVTVYDDLVARPESVFLDNFTTGSDPTHLYGYQDETLYDLAVNASGLTVTGSSSTALIYPSGSLGFAKGLVYDGQGQVIDPVRLIQTSRFTPPSGVSFVGDFFPDPQLPVVYGFAKQRNAQTIDEMLVYNAGTNTLKGTYPLAGVDSNPLSFVVWGRGRVAFNTQSGHVFLVDTTSSPNAAQSP